MALERKKTLNVFKEARAAWGSYDEYPVGPAGTDPMPHLSRNRVPQPFFLVCEEDQVLVQMAGEGALELREVDPSRMRLVPGDTVYIPAGVPTRVVPDGENVQVRLKAEPPGREAVAWYCEGSEGARGVGPLAAPPWKGCGALVHARELDAGIVQDQYWRAVEAFNADPLLRTCAGCGAVQPPADLGDIAWLDVAAALRAEV